MRRVVLLALVMTLGAAWFHDPANSDKPRRGASRGGKGNQSKVSKELHQLLEDLTGQVIGGELAPYPASVAGQLIDVRLRLMEHERRVRHDYELAERIAQLEESTPLRAVQER